MSSPKVVVVGAGVIGLAVTRALVREGLNVTVVDRGPPGGEASAAAAGMLAPQLEAHAGGPLLSLGVAAREHYHVLAASLAERGHDIGLNTSGIVHVAFDELRAVALRSQADAQRKMGLDADWLNRADLLKRHPSLNPAAGGALFAPRDGCVNNLALCSALAADARAHGAQFVAAEVVELTRAKTQVTGVRTELDRLPADHVVLAGGAWSGLLVGLSHPLPVEPMRGQMAALPWPRSEPASVVYADDGYLVPRGVEALAGSTMERAGFAKETTEKGQAQIVKAAAKIFPALAGATVLRRWSGLRPMTPDTLPILGFDPQVAGLVYATGHGRNGILLAPLTGQIVRDLVVTGETRWDISAYAVTRFG